MGWGSNSSSKEGQVKSNQFVNSFVASSSSSSLCRYRAALVSSTSKPQQLSATPFLLLSFKMPLFRVVKEKKESMKTLEVRVSFHFFPRKFCSFFRFLLFEKHKKNPTFFGQKTHRRKAGLATCLLLLLLSLSLIRGRRRRVEPGWAQTEAIASAATTQRHLSSIRREPDFFN